MGGREGVKGLLPSRCVSSVTEVWEGPSPVYSGKQILKGDFLIFSANKSFLLRKRMMEVSMKNLLLQMESKSIRDSCMRFCRKKDTYKIMSLWT